MKPISRDIAENLVDKALPVDSRIDHSEGILSIIFVLKNGESLIVKYDQQEQKKLYYLIEKN